MINHSNENTLLDDANSPELDKKKMGEITEDFLKVCDNLKEASYQIRSRKFSEYPIFVATDAEVSMGQTLFYPQDFKTKYEYKASFLEEFLSLNLIGPESEVLFKENYKNADEYCCLFVKDGNFVSFVYVPFPID
ncbi:hypothetical protein LAG90_07405 [Marinilongibacter aquaticus]|uniref:hypothetical protein n=1 Tax=Marinilongibacter aquaticus TaxID=2975157 RepID=UPI0021BD4361|nr:hypothetical protein [Marinilongibacter aquaticus]UBM60465.1 hypothetical protein LAG90_07405 [Marinilongibacter aquaticus]